MEALIITSINHYTLLDFGQKRAKNEKKIIFFHQSYFFQFLMSRGIFIIGWIKNNLRIYQGSLSQILKNTEAQKILRYSYKKKVYASNELSMTAVSLFFLKIWRKICFFGPNPENGVLEPRPPKIENLELFFILREMYYQRAYNEPSMTAVSLFCSQNMAKNVFFWSKPRKWEIGA